MSEHIEYQIGSEAIQTRQTLRQQARRIEDLEDDNRRLNAALDDADSELRRVSAELSKWIDLPF